MEVLGKRLTLYLTSLLRVAVTHCRQRTIGRKAE